MALKNLKFTHGQGATFTQNGVKKQHWLLKHPPPQKKSKYTFPTILLDVSNL